MKTIFDHINNILNKKNDYELNEGDEFTPYMIQRWMSMISPEMAYVLNETCNSAFPAMQDKQMWHDYFLTIMPKTGYPKKIQYLKKDKAPVPKDVSDLAKQLEISCREAQELIKLDPSLNKKQKTVELLKKNPK